jgi:hypothetical protein
MPQWDKNKYESSSVQKSDTTPKIVLCQLYVLTAITIHANAMMAYGKEGDENIDKIVCDLHNKVVDLQKKVK